VELGTRFKRSKKGQTGSIDHCPLEQAERKLARTVAGIDTMVNIVSICLWN
jgi:hypothetical protein